MNNKKQIEFMMTIQEIYQALENAGWSLQNDIWQSEGGYYEFDNKPTRQGIIVMILSCCYLNECYIFHTGDHIEYDENRQYGVNELLKDLKKWL